MKKLGGRLHSKDIKLTARNKSCVSCKRNNAANKLFLSSQSTLAKGAWDFRTSFDEIEKEIRAKSIMEENLPHDSEEVPSDKDFMANHHFHKCSKSKKRSSSMVELMIDTDSTKITHPLFSQTNVSNYIATAFNMKS